VPSASSRSRVSRGMERVTPVPRADGDTLRDCRAETVQVSILIADSGAGCWSGGGTEE